MNLTPTGAQPDEPDRPPASVNNLTWRNVADMREQLFRLDLGRALDVLEILRHQVLEHDRARGGR